MDWRIFEMTQARGFNRRAFLALGAQIAVGSKVAIAGGGRSAEMASVNSHPPAGLETQGAANASVAAHRKRLRPLGVFLANHDGDTCMHLWKLDRWERQIADLKRMGADTIWFLPMEFGQHSSEEFEDMADYWRLQRAICRSIKGAGLEVGIYLGANDICRDTWSAHPGWHAVRGDFYIEQAEVCPSVPEAREEIFKLRKKLLRGLSSIDYLQVEMTDYGGCACDMCAPYAKTYFKILEELATLCRRYHPGAKIVASGINAPLKDVEMLREALAKAAWADYVWELPRGPKPVIKAAFCPETTMVNGWGKFGPCPVLPQLKRGYQEDFVHLSGVAQYSEGIHDDVNKFAVLQFAGDPGRSVDGVAMAYAEEWLGLGGRDVTLAADVITGLGTEIVTDRYYYSANYGANNPEADERVKVLLDLRSRNPFLRKNFRYWLLHYRAVCESFATPSGSLSLEVLGKESDVAREALLRLEPEYGKFLVNLHAWFRPGHSPWNWPRSFHAAWLRENRFAERADWQRAGRKLHAPLPLGRD